jgi:lipopolysaccharide transport system ATP-binding protein
MGHYTLGVILSERARGLTVESHLQVLEEICPFEVVMYGKTRSYPWQGGTCTYLEDCHWQIEKVDSDVDVPHEAAMGRA